MLKTTVCAGAVLLCAGVSVYSNSFIGVTHYNLSFPDLPAEFDGFKIVQVSDLHNKRFGKNQQYLLKKIGNCNPDIIVITGDIIHDKQKFAEVKHRVDKVRPFLTGATKIAPVYYATGNHELETGHTNYIWKEIEQSGVNVLINRYASITRGNANIGILGAADPLYYGSRRAYGAFREAVKELCTSCDGFKILLSHRPELIDVYGDAGVQLALTGHAHGGQIRIPFTSQGLFAPDQGVMPKYTQGVHSKGDTQMVISRGLGNSGFPQRLFDRPELVLITLHKA